VEQRPTHEGIRKASSLVAPVFLFLVFASWAFSSPPGSAPDDDFHLASIWCGQGIRDDLCEPGSLPTSRMVPKPLTSIECFTRESSTSASCWDPNADGLAEATWLNTYRLYPPTFYAIFSPIASANVEKSVVSIRLANSMLYTALLVVAFWALPRELRFILVFSTAVTLVPVGLFIVNSTNPSSWAVMSASVTFACTFGALKTTGRRHYALIAIALFAGLLGSSARIDAGIFSLYSMGIAGIVGLNRSSNTRAPLTAFTIVSVAVLTGIYASTQVSSFSEGLPAFGGGPLQSEPLDSRQIMFNALFIPVIWAGISGIGPLGKLGWFDTPMPTFIGSTMLLLIVGAFALTWFSATLRLRLSLLVCLLAFWFVPFAMLYQSSATIPDIVQPRYILPLLITMVAVACTNPRFSQLFGVRATIGFGIVLTIGCASALLANINRFTYGVNDTGRVLRNAEAWWWEFLAIEPALVVGIGTVSLALLSSIVAFAVQHSESPTP
jgi:hypothetical protein